MFPLRWVNAEGEVSRGYREDGYFPEAFVNMLAFLGWNPGDDTELYTLDELVPVFSLERVIKSGARFNADKAKWYNKEYLRAKPAEELADLYAPILEKHGIKVVDCPACALVAGSELSPEGFDFQNHIFTKDYVARVVETLRDRATFVSDFWDAAPYLFVAPEDYVVFDIKAGAAVAAPERVDPRAKVYAGSPGPGEGTRGLHQDARISDGQGDEQPAPRPHGQRQRPRHRRNHLLDRPQGIRPPDDLYRQ